MLLRICVSVETCLRLADRWLAERLTGLCARAVGVAARARPARARGDERGQATAEYALVIVGAAAVALLLLGWATGSGKIAWLLDSMVDKIAGMVQ